MRRTALSSEREYLKICRCGEQEKEPIWAPKLPLERFFLRLAIQYLEIVPLFDPLGKQGGQTFEAVPNKFFVPTRFI